jgi:mannose-1-phosphate guanylyltransferase
MILAAGLGTRLRPLTDVLAKPLVPVGDAPMLAHVIARLREVGCAPIVANAHHHKEAIARFCAASGVSVSSEDDLLGTAGGLAHAAPLLGDGDVLVHNGDVLATVDLAALVGAHTGREAGATLAVVFGPPGTGNIGIDATGRVVRLRTETFAEGEERGGAFTGIHVVSARIRATLPAKGCVVGDVYMPRLRRVRDLWAEPASDLVDIGTLEGYLRANLAWLAKWGASSFVDSGVEVAPGVELASSVVGAGARVRGAGRLERCVVWPNAEALAPAVGRVFTGVPPPS